MSLFAGMKEAKPSSKAEYMRPGHYWCVVKKCKVGKTRKGIEFYVNEMEIVRVLDDCNGVGHKDNDEVSHMVMKTSEFFLNDIKAFLCAALGMAVEDIDEQTCLDVTKLEGEDAQPLKWMVIEVKAREVPTKAGGLFTAISYVREVPIDEVIEKSNEVAIERAFPDEVLQSLLEEEA